MSFSIQGKVKNGNTPVQGKEVTILNANGEQMGHTYTNQNGIFFPVISLNVVDKPELYINIDGKKTRVEYEYNKNFIYVPKWVEIDISTVPGSSGTKPRSGGNSNNSGNNTNNPGNTITNWYAANKQKILIITGIGFGLILLGIALRRETQM